MATVAIPAGWELDDSPPPKGQQAAVKIPDGWEIDETPAPQPPAEQPAPGFWDRLVGGAKAVSDLTGSSFGYPLHQSAAAFGLVSPPSASAYRAENDTAVSLGKGFVQLGQAATGLADITLPGAIPLPITQAAETAGLPVHLTGWSGWMQEKLGIKYEDANKWLNEKYSTETQKAHETVANAEGWKAKIGAALSNPSSILTSIGESIPTMVAGGFLGKGLGALGKAESFLAKYGYAMGEGAMSAGSAQEQARAASPTGLTTPTQTGLSMASGTFTGLISALSGNVASKLGIEDINKLLSGTVSKEAKQSVIAGAIARALAHKNPLVRGAGKAAEAALGFAQEGTEEAVQSWQEQILGNLSQGKPWYEGVEQSAVMGMLTGGAMGAGTQLRPRPISRSDAQKIGVPEEVIRQGQEARTAWATENTTKVAAAIQQGMAEIAAAVESGDMTKKQANAKLQELHRQYVQPQTMPGVRPLPTGVEFTTSEVGGGVERVLTVAGKEVGSTSIRDVLPADVDRQFPGLRGDAPVRQLSGIQIPDATPSNRRKGYGRAMLLDAFAQQPDGWLYSSQMTPSGVDVLGKLQTDGLVEVAWKKHGAKVEPFTLNRYSGEIRNWMARLTDKGRDSLGIPTQEPTNAQPIESPTQDDARSRARVETGQDAGTATVRSKGLRDSGQAGAQGETQGVAQPSQTQGQGVGETAESFRVKATPGARFTIDGYGETFVVGQDGTTIYDDRGRPMGDVDTIANERINAPERLAEKFGKPVSWAETQANGQRAVVRFLEDTAPTQQETIPPPPTPAEAGVAPQLPPPPPTAPIPQAEPTPLRKAKELKQGTPLKTAEPIQEAPVDAEVVPEPPPLPPQQPPPLPGQQPGQPGPEFVGLANSVRDALRETRGLLPNESWNAQGAAERAVGEAVQTLRANPAAGYGLVNEIVATPRNLSGTEGAILTIEMRMSYDRYTALADQQTRLLDAGNAQAAAQMENAVANAHEWLNRTEQAAKNAGTAWHESGMVRQILMAKDHSIQGITRQMRRAKGGKDLTIAERTEAANLAKHYAEATHYYEGLLEGKRQERLKAADDAIAAQAQQRRDAVTMGRAKELLKTAANYGLDENEVQARAHEMARNENAPVDAYNRALKQAESITGLDRKKIADMGNNNKDAVANTPGLDVSAIEVARQVGDALGLPPISEGVQGADIAQTVVDAIRSGPKKKIGWSDRITQAAESLAKDKGITTTFSWENQGDLFEGEAEPNAPKSSGKKTTPKPAKKSDVARQKVAQAIAELKKAQSDWARGTAPTIGGLPVELLGKLVNVARAYVDLGISRFSEWLAAAKQDGLGEDIKDNLGAFKTAWDQLMQSGVVTPMNVDAEDPAAIGRLARKLHREFYEAGVPNREARVDAVHAELQSVLPDISRTDTIDAMSGYGKFRELSKDDVSVEVRKDNGELQQLRKIEDLQNAIEHVKQWRANGIPDADIARMLVEYGYLPKKSGIERRKVDALESDLITQVNNLKKELPVQPIPSDKQAATALSTAKKALENRLRRLQEAVRLKTQIPEGRKAQFAPEDQAALDATRQEIAFWNNAYRKLFPTEAQKAAMERAADQAAQADFASEGGPTGAITEQQRILAAATVMDGILKRQQAELDKLKLEGWQKKSKGEKLTSPMLEAKQAEIDANRALRDELLQMDPAYQADVEARSHAAYKRALATRLASRLQLLADTERTGQLPEKKPPRVLDQDEIAAKAQIAEVVKRQKEVEARIRSEQRTTAQRVIDKIPQALNLHRAFLTAWEISGTGRQGGVVAMTNPVLWAKAFAPMWQSMKSEQGQLQVGEIIKSYESYELAQKADLANTMDAENMSAGEEAFMYPFAKEGKVGKAVSTILSPFERSHVTFLNYLRASVFDSMVQSLGGAQNVTIGEAKLIANWLNIATGRGPLGAFQAASNGLATYLFSPRFAISRFQLLLGYPLWTGLIEGNYSPRARMLIAKQYGKMASGTVAMYGMTALAGAMLAAAGVRDDWIPKVSFDTRSADGFKIRFGNTRLDPLAGLSQVAIFLTRIFTGSTKKPTGEVVKFADDPRQGLDILTSFERSKLAPVAGLAVDLATRWNTKREPTTLGTVAANQGLPLFWRDVYETMQEQGVAKGTAMSVLSALGMGINTYTPKAPKQSKGLKSLGSLK